MVDKSSEYFVSFLGTLQKSFEKIFDMKNEHKRTVTY